MKKARQVIRTTFVLIAIPAVLSLFAAHYRSNAALVTRTWDGGGVTNNWSDAANWSGDVVPTSDDSAVFDSTSTKNCTIDVNIPSPLMINLNAGYSGAVTMAPGVAATFGNSSINSGAFNADSGTVSFTSTLSISGGAYNAGSGTSNIRVLTQSGGTFNGSAGNVTSDLITVNGGTFNSPTGTIELGAGFGGSLQILGGTADLDNGTIAFIGGLNVGFDFGSSIVVNNLVINKPPGNTGVSFSGTATVNGTLTLIEGIIGGGTVKAQNGVSIAPTFGNQNPNGDGGGGNILIQDGSGARTIDLPAGVRLPNLRINDSSVSITTSGTGSVNTDDLILDAISSADFGANNLLVGYSPFFAGSPFTMNAGTMTFTSGSFMMNTSAAFTLNNGTFTMGSGTADMSGSASILINGGTFNAPTGPTNINPSLAGSYTQTGGVFNGNGTLDFNSGFNLSGGTFNASTGNTFFGFGFQQTGGTFNHLSGTATFDSSHPSYSLSVGAAVPAQRAVFNNLVISLGSGDVTFSGATKFQAVGSLQIINGRIDSGTGGGMEAMGDVMIGAGADGGNSPISFIGTADQTFTNNGGLNTTGTWTVNKPSGTVTAATDMLLATNQTLNITSGTLYLADGSDLTVGPLNIAAAGRLINDSATTITLGGNVANAGNIFMLGGGSACPESDSILIRSSVDGSQRTWSGAGSFAIADADIRDMAGTASVIAYNSTNTGNNGPNWTFDAGCPPAVSISPQVVSIYRNQTQVFTAGGGYGNRSFTIAVNNSGASINPATGLYTPGNTMNVTDTVRVTDAFGQFADAQVTVIPGPPTKLAIAVQPPGTIQAGAPISEIRVALLDDQNTPIPNASNAVTVSLLSNPSGSTLSGTLTRSAVNGIATFDDISLNRPGTGHVLLFTSGGLTETNSITFSVVPGPPSRLAFVNQPLDSEANAFISGGLLVEITDSAGNRIPNATNAITMSIENNPSGGILSGVTVISPNLGYGEFRFIKIDNPGIGYTLTASAVGLSSATSNPFNIISPFVVTNTADGGLGSLRNAITKANQTAGTQTISFNIPGAGPHTIEPSTKLPEISDPMTIDGTTQPGFSGTPIIELNGNNRVAAPIGLDLRTGNNTIKGLTINRFNNAAILISPGITGGNTIQTNYIGTTTDGDGALPNGTGIVIATPNNLIGGTTASERNLISGNLSSGILIGALQSPPSASSGNVVMGNLIGTNAAGNAAIPNLVGITIASTGTTIGGVSAGQPNLIAFNSQSGLRVNAGSSNQIQGNLIHSNGNLGIDLVGDGVTPNDPGDLDFGPNLRQNFPVLDFAIGGGASTRIAGTLNSSVASNHTIDFYSNPACDAGGYGEGRIYLGSTNITTNASNLASFDVVLPTASVIGHFVTATATDTFGNTSEFSQCKVISASTVTISGRITNSSGASLRNVRVVVSGAVSKQVLTNIFGQYSVSRLPSASNYTVRPVLVNHDFSPPTRTYNNVLSDQINQDFVSTKTRASITGNLLGIVGESQMPLSGVTVMLSGTASRSAISNGSYAFHDLPPGPYTVTATKDGWTFGPLSLDVNLTLADASLTHVATQETLLEGRIFFSSLFPKVINSNGTAEHDINSKRIRPGFDASHDGTKIAYVGNRLYEPSGMDSIYTANSDGTGEELLVSAPSPAAFLTYPRFSPDGSKIAYINIDSSSGSYSIRVRDLATGTTLTVAFDTLFYESYPDWISPTRLVFHAFDGNDYEIYAVNTNGSGLTKLTDNSVDDRVPSVSYDGSRIAYHSLDLGVKTIKAMNSDGSNKVTLRNDASSAITPAAWSPDGTMLAMVRAAPGNVEYSIINSTNGSLITDLSTSGFSSHPFFDWAPDLGAETQPGTDVQIELGGVDLTFTGVTTSGTTTVTRIPPSSAGTAPNGFLVGGLAYEITTTAAYTAPVSVCFNVPSQYAPTQTAFNQLNLMHNEGGVLVNRTTSRDFPTRTICGSVTTLSPFVLAEEINPALPSISGYVEDSNGVPMPEVSVQLTGAENRVAQTDVNGFFTFVNLIDGESYTVQPKSLGYLFSEYSADLFEITSENSLVFTGTQASFQISGRVTNGVGQGIGGVEVVLEGAAFKETLTDSNGDYVLTDLPAEGAYTVQVIAAGFSASPNQFEVAPLVGNFSSVDFMLLAPTAAPASISGRVVDRHGRGVQGANITVQKGDGSREVAVTNTFGHYRINGLPAGETYVLQVSARRHSFTNAVQVVSLQADIAGMDFIASGP